jgi:predicted NACHT family NTPase
MSDRIYSWQRFWCPRSGRINLADGGYLCDPEAEWGNVYNPDLVTFEAISKLPCLVLLGEPGMGKTHAMTAEQAIITTKIQEQGGQVLLRDLRSYSSPEWLARKLFESAEFTNWLKGTHQLHIFLDSLDECLLRIETLATLLVDEFKEYRAQIQRLHLRIACRTAIWPPVLEDGLKQLWGKDAVGVYELTPLRRKDVREAARAEEIDLHDFLEEVQKKNIVSLAIKPVTLKFLLNTYRRHNSQFPANQRLHELYLEGCRCLSEESNKSRLASRLKGKLNLEQRLMVAARIAAVTIFANRFAVWTGREQDDVPDEDVLLRKICQGSESVSGREFEVNETVVEEVLDTGLFSSRGLNRMGWAHQTYAEFLAAWYLKQHNLHPFQMMNLIVQSDEPDSRIIPQLHETVAWLASRETEVFREVMKTDPDVLLQSDISTASEADKTALVESLLELHNQEKLVYQPGFRLYENLNHSVLPDQLHPYICDSTKSIHSRYVAIDIAEACNVQAVQDSLINVALDAKQPYWVRIRAAMVINHVGDEKTKARLKPLAVGEAENDPEDKLKGYALQAVYPDCMTTEEVFSRLTQPKAKYIGGSYQEFIARDFGSRLPLSDLPIALRWLGKQPVRHELHYPFRELSDAILLKAWEHLEEQEILELFTQVTFIRLKRYDRIFDYSHKPSFKQLLEENDNKRRQLIEAVIYILPDSEQEPLWLAGYSKYSQLTPLKQDFLWLIERLQASNSEHIQKIYAKLIRWKLDWNNADQVSAILTASQSNLVLRSEFSLELEPIKLGSSKAEKAKAEYLRIQEMLTPENRQTLLEPSPRERVLTALSQLENGEIGAWWHLCREMTLMPTSTHYDERFEPDLTALPGWKEAEEATKIRIIAAAKVYIYQGEPETNAWLGTNSFRYSALAGYKALRLILLKEPEFISTISADMWKKWTSIILDYPNAGEDKNKEIRQKLVKLAYLNAPDEFIRTLMILINEENKQLGSIHITDQVRHCWDERLATVILDKVKAEPLTAKSLGCLLKELLIYQVNQAKTFAESLISIPPPNSGEERAKAIVAAQMLILYAEDAGWLVVWRAIQEDPEFGREVMESVSYSIKFEGSVEQRLKEDCIADLYIFLVQQYPDTEESQEKNSQDEELNGVEAYVMESEDSIKIWRDYIPQRLQERGTAQACEALRKIIRTLPELKDKLQWRLLEAEALSRRQTWKPLKPDEILQIVSNKQMQMMKTVLLLAANPKNSSQLRLSEEVREIDEGLTKRARYREQFKLESKLAVRQRDFYRHMLDIQPQIVHFSGHGAGEDGIVLEDDAGNATFVQADMLASMFKLFASKGVECVLFNACYSEVQAEAVSKYIPYVIGMNQPIGDKAAIDFAVAFYDALGAGETMEFAFELGCSQLVGLKEHETPVFFVRGVRT